MAISEMNRNNPDFKTKAGKKVNKCKYAFQWDAYRPQQRPSPGGCQLRGVSASGGGDEADTPVNRITDRCKNITFATSLRTVKIEATGRTRLIRSST